MIGYTAKQSNRLLCTLIPPNVVSALTSGSSGYNGDGCAGGPIGREIQHCTVMFCSLAQLGELQVDDLTWHPLKALLAHSVPFALFSDVFKPHSLSSTQHPPLLCAAQGPQLEIRTLYFP